MPKSKSSGGKRPRRERRLSIRTELRTEPDLQKIAGAVIALAMAQAEKEAQAQRAREERRAND